MSFSPRFSLSRLALSTSRLPVLTLPHSLNPTYTIHRTRHLYHYAPPPRRYAYIRTLFLVLLPYPRRSLPAISNLSLSLGRTNERWPLYYSGVFGFSIKSTRRLEIESALIPSFPRNVASDFGRDCRRKGVICVPEIRCLPPP